MHHLLEMEGYLAAHFSESVSLAETVRRVALGKMSPELGVTNLIGLIKTGVIVNDE